MNKPRASSKQVELLIEWMIFSSRWLLAPFYLGLALTLIVLLSVFVYQFSAFLSTLGNFEIKLTSIFILQMIELALTASLVLMVMLTGYESFVSRIDIAEHAERPAWMGKVDFNALKLKLVSSLVAISSIQLLESFLKIGEDNALEKGDLLWMVAITLTFVVSGLLLALTGFISCHSPDPSGEGKPASMD